MTETDVLGKEVKAVMPTYISFLMGKLQEIWTAWDQKDPEFALSKALRLVLFLPKDLKNELREDTTEILHSLSDIYSQDSFDMYTTHLYRNDEARKLALNRLAGFIDHITDLLDARGYLEKVKEFKKGRWEAHA